MRTITKLLLVAAIGMFSVAAQAQLKIGHVNSQELLASMPETDSAQKKIEQKQVEHNLRMEEIQVEFNKKLAEYQEKVGNTENPMSLLEQQDREAELQSLQERAANYEQVIQQDLQMLQMQLFQPIQEKAISAINEVAEENGFTYILDTGAGAVVYKSPDSEDILPLVKTKLGLE